MAGEFDLHQLLAGPIVAMNDAQADAAASFYELFEQFAFEPQDTAARGGAPEARSLRMISFVAERATAGGIERRQISMPLLQMIPIGGIAIDSAKIEFSLAVNAEPPASARARAGTAAPAIAAGRAVALKGRIAPAAASDAAGAGNLRVEIVLKQVDLPAGYLDMIAETQGGMSRIVPEVKADEPQTDPDAPLFTATVREASAKGIRPGEEHVLFLEITPNPELVGRKGLEVEMAAEPKTAFSIEDPSALSHVGTQPRFVRVVLNTSRTLARGARAVSLVLNGASDGPDGVRRQHIARILLPHR